MTFTATDAAGNSGTAEGVVTVTEAAAPPVEEKEAPSAAGFTGTAQAAGSTGLLVTSGESMAAELISVFADAGCPVESLSILVTGAWSVYIAGAPDIVNAAFPATLAATTPFFVRC